MNVQQILFSIPSVIVHTVWFVGWFLLGFSINTLTLIVSLEAIYITLFIGLEQQTHGEDHKQIKTLIRGR